MAPVTRFTSRAFSTFGIIGSFVVFLTAVGKFFYKFVTYFTTHVKGENADIVRVVLIATMMWLFSASASTFPGLAVYVLFLHLTGKGAGDCDGKIDFQRAAGGRAGGGDALLLPARRAGKARVALPGGGRHWLCF